MMMMMMMNKKRKMVLQMTYHEKDLSLLVEQMKMLWIGRQSNHQEEEEEDADLGL
jgi:hypothetical protein